MPDKMVKCSWCPAQHLEGDEIATHRMQCASRPAGTDPRTGAYSTLQMLRDEMMMGDTSQPLFD